MKCRDVEILLVELADGTINAGDRERVEAHLAVCASCAANVALLSSTFAALRNETEEAPPAHYFTNLLPKIRMRLETAAHPWRIAVPMWLHNFLAPLTVTVMALIVVGLFRLFEPTEEYLPLKNFVGQVPADEIAALVSTDPFENDFSMSGSAKILDMAPNANSVADRMKAELLADELTVQPADAGIIHYESTLEELDEETVSQVLNHLNESTTL